MRVCYLETYNALNNAADVSLMRVCYLETYNALNNAADVSLMRVCYLETYNALRPCPDFLRRPPTRPHLCQLSHLCMWVWGCLRLSPGCSSPHWSSPADSPCPHLTQGQAQRFQYIYIEMYYILNYIYYIDIMYRRSVIIQTTHILHAMRKRVISMIPEGQQNS